MTEQEIKTFVNENYQKYDLDKDMLEMMLNDAITTIGHDHTIAKYISLIILFSAYYKYGRDSK